MTQEKILTELKEGNLRFIENKTKSKDKRPSELANGQSPHTIIITCADSRVPPEMIFDQDLGDLFVIRVAGNIATDEAIGSAEYAAANLGSSVCLVLGHSHCGAVGAAVDHVKNGASLPSPHLQKVVDPIVGPVKDSLSRPEDKILSSAIDLNINKSISNLLEKSSILKSLKDENKLTFHGARYELATGEVHFFK